MDIGEAPKKRGRGRPRAFDQEAALKSAMELFWQRGFEATSMSDLTEAMSISPSSLYATFGDKERLYQAAIDHYLAGPGSYAGRALAAQPTAKQAIEQLFLVAADELTHPTRPTGCMVVLSANQCSPTASTVQQTMHDLRLGSRAMIEDRLRQGEQAGEFPDGTDIPGLATYITATFHGMSILARDGASRETLLGVGRMALRAWPGET